MGVWGSAQMVVEREGGWLGKTLPAEGSPSPPEHSCNLQRCPAPAPTLALLPPVPQNLEVLYRQYGRDGNKHGLDWQEVAVCIIQDGLGVCDSSVLAGSTVQVGG